MPKQTPNFRGQQAADASSVATQSQTSENLITALGNVFTLGKGDTPGDILRTKGKLSRENRSALARGRFADQFAAKQQQGERQAPEQCRQAAHEATQ